MTLAWDIFRQMEQLQREMDEFLGSGRTRGFGAPRFRWSFLPGRAAREYPLLNVSEDADNVYVDALAPGLDDESLNISVVENQLTISGEKPSLGKSVEAEAYHRNERAAGRFVRVATLPAPVDQNKTTADYKNGLLCVVLPKAEQAKPQRISVNTD